MIYRIYSNMPTFKEFQFHHGLNVILADKSPGATERQTRNGAGKSSLTELIHFLLGSNIANSPIFRSPPLSQYSFGVDFDLRQMRIQVERSGEASSKVVIQEDSVKILPVELIGNRLFETGVISNSQWLVILGRFMFDLIEGNKGTQTPKFGPTFRSLFSYFVRRQSAGGFISPVKQAAQQQTWDQQVAISYLLGLDWTIPQQWQQIREKEKSLKELKKAVAEGTFDAIVGNSAELRTRLALSEERSRQLREHVSSFQVLPEYRNLENEASQLTRAMGTLADENTIDRRLLSELQEAFVDEVDPSINDLSRLYKEAGVILSEAVVRRFEDVRQFHTSIIENRKSYLDSEVTEATRRIYTREERMAAMNKRLVTIMAILQSHGALDQFVKLQAELTAQEAKTEAIRQQFAAAEQLEEQRSKLEFARRELEVRLRQDYHEQEEVLRAAILAFEKFSSALYEEAGNLTIDASTNGPQFDVTIRSAKSKGISNMQIFCFDMMLMQLCAERHIGPGFLVHDSHLFDGVDERQVAKALQLGERTARELNFQYIVTMNSDAVPHELPDNFDLNEYILSPRLTDATEEGGLFGVRF
ncbi:MAG TPA: ABC-three component system protein [Ktedonobacteraceae bacterium]|nr:ABC-three component system protein [Ktedonobacteraceae bacterium]